MSTDYLTLGPTPCDETCYPANTNPKMEGMELNAYRNQIIRVMTNQFGDDFCVRITVKKFQHDTPYSEVCVVYNPESEKETQQAFWIESNSPENWDAEAEKYFKDYGFIPWNVPKGHKSDGDIVDDMIDEHFDRMSDSDPINFVDPAHNRYAEVMAREDNPSSICEDADQPDEYCETCHVLGHGPNNCPARLWINQPQGKQIESEPQQHLLPGEVLRLVLPTGHKLEVEHTADTFTITVNDDVIFDAEKFRSGWEVTLPKHMSFTNNGAPPFAD